MPPPPASFTVGVMGSGTDEHDDLARPLGELLARLGVNLLTGGGGGVMNAVCRAFVRSTRSRGICIGVLPCRDAGNRKVSRSGYPNPFVEVPIRTHLVSTGLQGTDLDSRNHINVLSSDAVIALPGGAGTESEVALALAYGRPIIAFADETDRIGHFPEEVRRFNRIQDVEEFVRQHATQI